MSDPIPARYLGWLRIGLLALFLGAVVAEVVTHGAFPELRNAFADLALAAVLLSALALGHRGGGENFPILRSRFVAIALPVVIAILATYRSLRLPYLADDWFHLEILLRCPTPLHAFGTPLSDVFFRPVGLFVWWFFARLSPLDATLAHATCIVLFVIEAALVVPALRRCGASRGIAVAASACFAASPAAAGTVAWASNLYVILSVGFSLATIAWLPIRRATAGSVGRTFILSALAFLSKEDSFLLPGLLILVGAQFQTRHVMRGLRLAIPAAAALACVLVLRSGRLGGIGGYSDAATGRTLVIDHYLAGVIQTGRLEFPTSFFQPLFTWGGPSLAKSLIALVPLALLGLGGSSSEARRGVTRGLLMVLVALAPVVWTMPVGNAVGNARQLFLPSIGIAWIASALIAGLPFGHGGRMAGLALYVATSLVIGSRGLGAWEEAGRAFRSGSSAVIPVVAAAPPSSRVLVYGLPEVVLGAPCFLNVTRDAIPRMAGRPDVEWVPAVAHHAEFDLIVEVDARAGAAREVSRSHAEFELHPGETLRFDFTSDGDRNRFDSRDWIASSSPGPWELIARGAHSTLRLPVLGVVPGDQVIIKLDGSATELGRSIVPTVLVTSEEGDHFLRQPIILGEPIRLFPNVRTLRVEIAAPIGERMQLRGLTLEAR